MSARGYRLAIAGHKGGTGRTTAALALAWWWGQFGRQTQLLDCSSAGIIPRLAADAGGTDGWPGVRLTMAEIPPDGIAGEPFAVFAERMLVDCPNLTERSCAAVLARVDGVMLVCGADPLSFRTLGVAADRLAGARDANPKLESLGILLAMHDNQDSVQAAMLDGLRQRHGAWFLEPIIPIDSAMQGWPQQPGIPLPTGPASVAYRNLALRVDRWIATAIGRTHSVG
ncbi:ParA family protein [Tuwongella immobilis]|uniref:: CbiA n=1 Tax=Tuwongella immobilis TaxID=692036 RepID=A0A6C2YSL0_9BACT|nr:ParA family protein [Tuwongella immobilis]VIP04327.1 : CbiA [Tuwongella immobilis]VTS06016.1 : CbiA [Tuwongella immobilis]